jgi:hypothetical protein
LLGKEENTFFQKQKIKLDRNLPVFLKPGKFSQGQVKPVFDLIRLTGFVKKENGLIPIKTNTSFCEC